MDENYKEIIARNLILGRLRIQAFRLAAFYEKQLLVEPWVELAMHQRTGIDWVEHAHVVDDIFAERSRALFRRIERSHS